MEKNGTSNLVRDKRGRFFDGCVSLKRNGTIFNCLICNKEFYRSKSRIKIGKNKFCSINCKEKSLIGKRMSPKTEFKFINGNTSQYMKLKNKYSVKLRYWRNGVYERDKHTCQDCKKTGCVLNAHHLVPFVEVPEKRFDLDNGITLCVSCHIKREHIIRNKNKKNEKQKI
jgi:hypothetical protein